MDKIQMAKGKLARGPLPAMFNSEQYRQVEAFHQTLKQYAPTPLINLSKLAEKLGIQAILVKDESHRFGLNAFKALGASYAVHRYLEQHPHAQPVFVTTTDGNHGKGVAWAALQAGCRAEIFMPKGTVASRVQAIEALGNAKVTVTEWGYDDTVRWTRDYAQRNGYVLVQDTVLEDYHEIPQNIVLGYTTMIREVVQQIEEQALAKPTHVFLQAGVGSMAGGVLGWLGYVESGNAGRLDHRSDRFRLCLRLLSARKAGLESRYHADDHGRAELRGSQSGSLSGAARLCGVLLRLRG